MTGKWRRGLAAALAVVMSLSLTGVSALATEGGGWEGGTPVTVYTLRETPYILGDTVGAQLGYQTVYVDKAAGETLYPSDLADSQAALAPEGTVYAGSSLPEVGSRLTDGMEIDFYYRPLPSGYAAGDTQWSTVLGQRPAGSDGILYEVRKEAYRDNYYPAEVRCIIPEGYAGDVHIDVGEALAAALGDGKTYLPGNAAPCIITVINRSGHSYAYEPGSFLFATEDYAPYFEAGVATDTGYVTFDGQNMPKEYGTYRTKNTAIQALYGVDLTSKVSDRQVSDEVLGAKLQELVGVDGTQLYPGGIADLNDYFLAYYNAVNGLAAEKLEDLPNNVIRTIFNGNVNGSKIFESNEELAALGYNWFYNHLMYLVPESVGYNDSLSDSHSAGAYMRDYAAGAGGPYESRCAGALGEIAPASEAGETAYSLEGFEMCLHGPDTVNVYQNYNFGFTAALSLRQTDVPQPVYYPVSYDANGGAQAGGATVHDGGAYAAGTEYAVLDNSAVGFVRDGFTFTGWNTAPDGTGAAYAAGGILTIPAADTVLYAQWQEIPPEAILYPVSYDANGGAQAGGATVHDGGAYAEGTEYAVLDNGAVGFVRDGFTFTGWNTAPDGTGAAYAAGGILTIPAADTVLYAQWQEIPPEVILYPVSYDANGGAQAGGSTVHDGGAYPEGTEYAVLGNGAVGFVRDGFTFTGWNTAPDGTGAPYAANSTLTIPASDTVLYAQWSRNATPPDDDDDDREDPRPTPAPSPSPSPVPEENIPDQPTPLNPAPEEDIPEQPAPLAPAPEGEGEEVTIEEPGVPLGNLPQTGAALAANPTATLGMLALAASLAGAGIAISFSRRKEEE